MFMPVLAELFQRVRHIREQNVTTGDLGYAGAISGHDLVELVRETADTSADTHKAGTNEISWEKP